jgi:hypothetical protein
MVRNLVRPDHKLSVFMRDPWFHGDLASFAFDTFAVTYVDVALGFGVRDSKVRWSPPLKGQLSVPTPVRMVLSSA